MARRVELESFDTSKPVYTRRNFIAAGHKFQTGQVFNWRNMSVSTRKVTTMFSSGHLTHIAGENVHRAPATKTDVTPTVEPDITPTSVGLPNIDHMDRLMDLQEIAREEGAELQSTKLKQRQSILDNREIMARNASYMTEHRDAESE